MMNIKRCLGAVIIGSLLSWTTVASANSSDILSTTIPASACQPNTPVASGRVALSNGAYVFSGNATGEVVLYCPLPVSRHPSRGGINPNSISTYRVYYRDSDGAGNASEITTRLFYRDANGQAVVGSAFSSNLSNITANTARFVTLSHTLQFNRLYYFIVTIRRNSTAQNPAFSGIDFEFIPPG